jgi:hypothetical protein
VNGLLQLRVLGFGFFQDGDVGVGVFPEGEGIFLSGERPDAGGIGLPALNIKRIVRFALHQPAACQGCLSFRRSCLLRKYVRGVVPSIVRNMSIKALTLS